VGVSRIAQIREAVESRSEELVGLLDSFVRIPAENPPGSGLKEAQAWIGDRLSEYGIDYESYPTSRTDTDHAVIIGKLGDSEQFLYLHGHYDVVPAFTAEQFVPQIRDGPCSDEAPRT
jgi:acetylornithine deacetylase/succinyl-diaminopimelate desuccinylase-like protein